MMSEASKNGRQSEANSQPPPSVISALPSFEEFERKLLPELRQIHEVLRPSFLFRAYELAKKKLEREAWREHERVQARDIRVSVKGHKKISTQVRKAIRAINVAEQLAAKEDPELLQNLDVIESRKLLLMAEADLQWVIRDMFPGAIHPTFAPLKLFKDTSGCRSPMLRGLRSLVGSS